jgi:hypothetical protein
MKEITITYQDREYTVSEPSIEIWTKLAAYKDILDESSFLIQIIKESTGLSESDIRKADWFDIMSVGAALAEYLTEQNDKFENEFEFKGKKYRFIDLPNLSFGEFIDIDTVLSKPEHERKSSLPLIMALLYREVDEKGKLVEYDSSRVQERGELFKQLPVRYVHGALGFFLHLEKMLQKPSLKFLVRMKWLRVTNRVKKVMRRVFRSIGGGLESLLQWPIKTLQRLVKSRNTH